MHTSTENCPAAVSLMKGSRILVFKYGKIVLTIALLWVPVFRVGVGVRAGAGASSWKKLVASLTPAQSPKGGDYPVGALIQKRDRSQSKGGAASTPRPSPAGEAISRTASVGGDSPSSR
jgi:hypothetical protein